MKRITKIRCILSVILLAISFTSCTNNSQEHFRNIVYENNTQVIYATPQSTCFSSIGYDAKNHTLIVVVRDSGVEYNYYDVPEKTWKAFYNSDSLGGYFNEKIKEYYNYKIQ